ncbi:MAG: MaoC family dehydratase N-terminal domain-containing protein [Deltaproteobacteria bacterium]
MLIDLNADLTPIKFFAEPLTSEKLSRFSEAVGAKYSGTVAPSFGTAFRKAEFQFLDRLKVDFKNLLHTDQEYEFLGQLGVGDIPEVETKMLSARERRGMVFVVMETTISVKGQPKIKSVASFILRENNKV